jgi:hypothetical protein
LLKDNLGEANIDFQKTVYDHVTNLLRFDKTDEAIEQLTYLRGIQEESIGRAHPDYSTTLQSLADACEKTGDTESANRVREELKNIRQNEASRDASDGTSQPTADKR